MRDIKLKLFEDLMKNVVQNMSREKQKELFNFIISQKEMDISHLLIIKVILNLKVLDSNDLSKLVSLSLPTKLNNELVRIIYSFAFNNFSSFISILTTIKSTTIIENVISRIAQTSKDNRNSFLNIIMKYLLENDQITISIINILYTFIKSDQSNELNYLNLENILLCLLLASGHVFKSNTFIGIDKISSCIDYLYNNDNSRFDFKDFETYNNMIKKFASLMLSIDNDKLEKFWELCSNEINEAQNFSLFSLGLMHSELAFSLSNFTSSSAKRLTNVFWESLGKIYQSQNNDEMNLRYFVYNFYNNVNDYLIEIIPEKTKQDIIIGSLKSLKKDTNLYLTQSIDLICMLYLNNDHCLNFGQEFETQLLRVIKDSLIYIPLSLRILKVLKVIFKNNHDAPIIDERASGKLNYVELVSQSIHGSYIIQNEVIILLKLIIGINNESSDEKLYTSLIKKLSLNNNNQIIVLCQEVIKNLSIDTITDFWMDVLFWMCQTIKKEKENDSSFEFFISKYRNLCFEIIGKHNKSEHVMKIAKRSLRKFL